MLHRTKNGRCNVVTSGINRLPQSLRVTAEKVRDDDTGITPMNSHWANVIGQRCKSVTKMTEAIESINLSHHTPLRLNLLDTHAVESMPTPRVYSMISRQEAVASKPLPGLPSTVYRCLGGGQGALITKITMTCLTGGINVNTGFHCTPNRSFTPLTYIVFASHILPFRTPYTTQGTQTTKVVNI